MQTLETNPTYERLETIDAEQDDSAYRQALVAALPLHGVSDPLAGYIHANLGVLDLLARDYGTALEHLWPVANGEIASTAPIRVMAMIRVAWILHNHQKDRLRAYQAYREIERFTRSEAVRARCAVECVGLLMELAESGKGSHEDVRHAARQAVSVMPSEEFQRHSTLELMFMETYARQAAPDVETAARLGEQFIARYSSMEENRPEREYAAALHQTGMYYQQLGEWDLALALFNRVFEEVPPGIEHFAGVDPHAQALTGLAHIANAKGEPQRGQQILRDVVELYPTDQAALRIRAQMPAVMSLTPSVTAAQLPHLSLPPSAAGLVLSPAIGEAN